jgi:hypothetical protein
MPPPCRRRRPPGAADAADGKPIVCGSSVEPFRPTHITVSKAKLTKSAPSNVQPSPSTSFNDFAYALPAG